ncbi:uncharacterized protein LOC142335837 [Convolutriloba macropyga]|uniref:uncharacterized protein LOC142335837 n=1 Tax=Convolutriloba macropyga TaxID=536237 RepID=UPI003F51EB74
MGNKGKKGGGTKSMTSKKSRKGRKGKQGKKGKKGKKRGKKGKKAPVNWRIKAMYGNDRNFDMMTNELKDLVSTYRQSGPVFALKQGLAAALKREFKQQFQDVDVALVGSSCSELAFDWTDVDLTLITPNQRPLDAKELSLAADILANQGGVPQSTISSLSTAIAGFGEYPVRFQNDVAVGFTFVNLDRIRAINPSVSRMVVFKQSGESVEVEPESSDHRDFVRELQRWDEELVKSKNDCGIGELFVGFFVYYQQFQFDQFELDVVTGEVRPRVLQDANYKNIKIAIRDPFSDRVASAFVTQSSFLKEFKVKLAQMEKQLGDSTNNLEEFLSFAGNTRREEVRGQFLPSVAASPMSTAR